MRGVTDVLVVGAGPVGLTLALGLRTSGLSVRVVDREPGTREEPRAAVIWPRGVEALDDVGAAGAVRSAANDLRRIDLFSRGRRLGTVGLGGGLDSAHPVPLIIEQHVTERLLEARLRALGVAVERGVEATALDLTPDGARTILHRAEGDRATEAVESAWIVGCDGSHSFVRRSLGIAFDGRKRRDLQILQVDATAHWRHPYDRNHGFYFIAPDACLGCFPRPGGGYRFFCYTTDPDPARKDPPSLPEMRDLIARVAGTPELQLTDETWLNRARFQTRFATTLRRGRALLAGDAAHVWATIGGHGMNIGLRGAHNLAWKLAAVHRGEAPDGLIDTYEAEERRAVSSFLRLMRFNLLEEPTTPLGFAPRELLLRAGLKVPGLPRRLERAVSDLDAAHDRSPLSRSAVRRSGSLTAGARAPDAGLVADGRWTSLHALLDYQRWTLVAPREACGDLGGFEPVRRGRVALVAGERFEGGLADLDRRRLMILVRPDRHIGLVARAGDVGALRAYLGAWFETPGASTAEPTPLLAAAE